MVDFLTIFLLFSALHDAVTYASTTGEDNNYKITINDRDEKECKENVFVKKILCHF